jgi:hypothetical protein
MKIHPRPIWIAIPMALVLTLLAIVFEISDAPVLLPLGITGLGSLTLASERWSNLADSADSVEPVRSYESTPTQGPEAQS